MKGSKYAVDTYSDSTCCMYSSLALLHPLLYVPLFPFPSDYFSSFSILSALMLERSSSHSPPPPSHLALPFLLLSISPSLSSSLLFLLLFFSSPFSPPLPPLSFFSSFSFSLLFLFLFLFPFSAGPVTRHAEYNVSNGRVWGRLQAGRLQAEGMRREGEGERERERERAEREGGRGRERERRGEGERGRERESRTLEFPVYNKAYSPDSGHIVTAHFQADGMREGREGREESCSASPDSDHIITVHFQGDGVRE